MKLTIVIPVFNEERTIAEIVERVLAVQLAGVDKEIVIVNDGSDDGTAAAIESSRWRADARIRVLSNPINLGKGAAVRVGIRHAAGDAILLQDADLELDPSDYGALIAPIADGHADVVYGSRFLGRRRHVPFATRAANRFLTWTTNVLFGARLTDMETGYKVFRRSAIDGIRLRAVGFDFEPEFTARLLMSGVRIHEVPIAYEPRRHEAGKKIRWTDGMDAVYVLMKCRLTGPGRRVAAAATTSPPVDVAAIELNGARASSPGIAGPYSQARTPSDAPPGRQ